MSSGVRASLDKGGIQKCPGRENPDLGVKLIFLLLNYMSQLRLKIIRISICFLKHNFAGRVFQILPFEDSFAGQPVCSFEVYRQTIVDRVIEA